MARLPDGADAVQASPLPSRSPPLLRLTPHIRQRIYRYLGLALWDRRPNKLSLHAGRLKLRHGRGKYELRFVPDPNDFHGLLLSCRIIYAEAATLLYSANQFVLYYFEPPADPDPDPDPHHPTSLRPLHTLHTLTAPSLLSLSNLKIVLNEAACHQLNLHDRFGNCCLHGREDLYWCKQKHEGLHQLPLLSPASAGDDDDRLAVAHAVSREWHSAAVRLFSCIAPGRLVLSLVCDIDPQHPRAIDVANSIVEPIRRLPRSHLKECHIRLAKITDGPLQQLAQDTVLHACGIPTPSLKPPSSATATTLATLPRELRIRILGYTDLVTPRRQVIWSRQDRAYVVCHFRSDLDDPPDVAYSDQFSECWSDESYGDGGNLRINGCFCRRRHAAFSAACKCWAPPGPALFLVSRTLYEDAQFVFFSSNRFIVHDYKPGPPWVLPVLERNEQPWDAPVIPITYPYPHERFAASEFLRHVVPTRSLAHLRFLELVFPPYRPPSWPETHHPAMQDWWSTVNWFRDKINPPGLTVRLMVVDTTHVHPPASYRSTITVEEGRKVMTAYMNLLRPLLPLAQADRGFARFYAHFSYPWQWTESEIHHRDDLTDDWLREKKEALKKRTEQYVMGHRYESLYANGREEPEFSDWYDVYQC